MIWTLHVKDRLRQRFNLEVTAELAEAFETHLKDQASILWDSPYSERQLRLVHYMGHSIILVYNPATRTAITAFKRLPDTNALAAAGLKTALEWKALKHHIPKHTVPVLKTVNPKHPNGSELNWYSEDQTVNRNTCQHVWIPRGPKKGIEQCDLCMKGRDLSRLIDQSTHAPRP